jgi:hypothetical protein
MDEKFKMELVSSIATIKADIAHIKEIIGSFNGVNTRSTASTNRKLIYVIFSTYIPLIATAIFLGAK